MAAHRYWRLASVATSAVSGDTTLGEIQFRDGGGTNRIGSGTPSASSEYPGGYVAANAVDGNPATEWSSFNDGDAGWWQYDFGAGNAYDIQSVVITASTYSADYRFTPSQFILLYSDDGTTWTDTAAVSAASAWTSGATQTIATPGTPIGQAWNSLLHRQVQYSNSNLTATCYFGQGGAHGFFRSAGKYYFEVTFATATQGDTGAGIANASANYVNLGGNAANGLIAFHGFPPYFNGSGAGALSGVGAVAQGTTLCVAVDLTSQLIWLKNGPGANWNGSAGNNPATNVGGFSYSAIGTSVAPVGVCYGTSEAMTLNTGGSTFAGTTPAGFTAWNGGSAAPTGSAQALAMILA